MSSKITYRAAIATPASASRSSDARREATKPGDGGSVALGSAATDLVPLTFKRDELVHPAQARQRIVHPL